MLNDGNWNGLQILSSDWIKKSTHPTRLDAQRKDPAFRDMIGYHYQWWLAAHDEAYLGVGHLGQFLYNNPKRDVIIVRLGRAGDDANLWLDLFSYLAENVE